MPKTHNVTTPSNNGTIEIRTWGTKNKKLSNFKENLKIGLFGGNIGHASVALKIPYNEENLALVKKYCDTNGIPYYINSNITPSLHYEEETDQFIRSEEIAYQAKQIVVYFSWFPGSNNSFSLNTPSEDYEAEWKSRKFKWTLDDQEFFQPKEKKIKGKIPISHTIMLGPKKMDLTSVYTTEDFELINQLEQLNSKLKQLLSDYFFENKLLWIDNTTKFSENFIEFLKKEHKNDFKQLKKFLKENHSSKWDKLLYNALNGNIPEHFDVLSLFSKLNLKIERNILRIKKNYTEKGIRTTSDKLQALEQLIKALESQRIKFLNEKTSLLSDKEINDINFLEAFIRDCRVLLNKNADIMPLYNLYKKNIPHFKQLENQHIIGILQKKLLPLLKEHKNSSVDDNFLTGVNKSFKKIQEYIDDKCNSLPGFFEDDNGLAIKKMLDEQLPEWESLINIPHIPLSNELSNLRRLIQKKIDEEIINNLDKQPIDGAHPDQTVTLPIHINNEKNSSSLYGLDLERMLKEMEYLVQNKRYKTYGINCAETVRRIVNSGLSHLNTKLHKNNILAISTPQTLMHEAISIGTHIVQLNYQKIRETIRRNKPFDFFNLLIRKKDHLFGHLCSQGELPSVEFDRLLVSQGKNIPYGHKDFANYYKQMEQTLIFNYVNIFEKLYKKEMASLPKKEIKKLGKFFREKTSDCFDNITELDAFTQSFVFYDILVHKRNKTKINAFRRWLDIAQALLEQESYAPFFAIINALNSPEISHCNLVSYLPNSYQNRFNQFVELCSPEHGYKNARKNLDLFSETSLTPFQWFSKETMKAYGHNSLQENDSKGYSPFTKILSNKVNCLRNFNDHLDKYQMLVVKKIQNLQKTKENNLPKYFRARSKESKQNLEEQSNTTYYRDMFFSKKTFGQSRNKKLEGLFNGILKTT